MICEETTTYSTTGDSPGKQNKDTKMKKTLVALIFGCSAGFTVMFLYPKFGLPDTDTNSIKMLIAFITTMLVINFKNSIFK